MFVLMAWVSWRHRDWIDREIFCVTAYLAAVEVALYLALVVMEVVR